MDGRQDSQSNAKADGDDKGHGPQAQRDRKRLPEDFRHGACLVDIGMAEIPPQCIQQEQPKLLPEGVIETILGGQVFLFGRAEGVIATLGFEWAAWGGVHHQKGHQCHGKKCRNEPQDTTNEIGHHTALPTFLHIPLTPTLPWREREKNGVVNLFVLISSGANRGTREGSLRTDPALRQPSRCLLSRPTSGIFEPFLGDTRERKASGAAVGSVVQWDRTPTENAAHGPAI
jgi:hypothetical protein